MTVAPQVPTLTAVNAVRPYVRIASAAGVLPNSGDVAIRLRPKQIARFAGGAELDVCRMDYNLGATGERIQDVQLVEDWNRQIDVRVRTFNAPAGAGILFWGETATSQLHIAAPGETVTIQAVVSPPLFGDILRGAPMLNADTFTTIVSEVDCVFNPIVDGKVLFNKCSRADPDNGFPLFVSPDSVRTQNAQDDYGIIAQEWQLSDALLMFLGMLNTQETFIKNDFQFQNLQLALLSDPPPLRNVRIPRGLYLPEILDRLLIPLGYNWYVSPGLTDVVDDPFSPVDEGELSAAPTITIFKRGQGREVSIYYQRVGESLDLRKSNAPDVNVEIDILDLANSVVGHGSFIEHEITIELFACWPFDDDDIPPDELDPTVEGSQYHNGKQHVWRRFAANEAGDWNNTRDRTTAQELNDVFEDDSYTQRRRRLFECLTYASTADGTEKRRPPYVEYYDTAAGVDNEGAWVEVPSDWSYEILKDEIGVRFNSRKIPGELYNLGSNVRVRVTGVVVGDHRLTSFSTGGASPNSNSVELFVDLSDKFHKRVRVNDGPYRSRFSSAGLGEEPINRDGVVDVTQMDADETDDLSELQTFIDELVDIEQAAKATAIITLSTIDYSYEIGDVIVGVYGRNISFNRLVPSIGQRYMQITSIVHDFERQTTRLKVESEEFRK